VADTTAPASNKNARIKRDMESYRCFPQTAPATPVPTYSTHVTRRFHLYTIARYARRKLIFSAMQAVQRYNGLAQSLTHHAFTNYNKSDGASLAQTNHNQYVYKSYSSIHIHKNKIITAFGNPSFLYRLKKRMGPVWHKQTTNKM
jgi:hypothetical protein